MKPTDRQPVLASLRQFGGTLSMSEAAEKFGVKVGTIKYWAKERNDGKVVPLKVAPALPVEPPPRATPPGREVRATAMAEALGPQLRGDLRESIGDLTRYIRAETRRAAEGPPEGATEDWRGPDMMQLAASARTLDTLLSRAADLLAFDRSTTMPEARDALDNPATVAAEIARRRRA